MSKSSCPVCDLGPVIVNKIRSLLANGEGKQHVAMLYGLHIDQLSAHIDGCIKPPRSRAERVRTLIDELEIAKEVAFDAMNQKASPGLQQGYARIVTEYRDAVEEYAKLQKPEDTALEIIERVINPLIREIIQASVEEMDSIKNQIIQYNVPRDVATKLIEESFKRQTTKLQATVDPAIKSLSKYLGIKNEEDMPDAKDLDKPSASKSGLN